MAIGPHDLIDLPGLGQFEVIGVPEDYTHGPFGYLPNFPTPFTVGHHAYSSTSTDGYNRDVETYTPAKGAAGTPVAVHGWANPNGTEPKIAGHDRVVVEVEMYMPPGLVINLRKVDG